MKLPCRILINNRDIELQCKKRSLLSILAIGNHSVRRHSDGDCGGQASTSNSSECKGRREIKEQFVNSNNVTTSTEVFIIIFARNTPSGKRYKITNNVKTVFTRFINDGRMTISLIEPKINIYIESPDTVNLKIFLSLLRSAVLPSKNQNQVQKSSSPVDNVKFSTLATTAVPSSHYPVTKLVISDRKDLPMKEFPNTLTCLIMNGLRNYKITSSILSLKHLTLLHLKGNGICSIPREFGDLKLVDLDLAMNKLGKCRRFKDWEWLNGSNLQNSLQRIVLSNNNLEFFPPYIVRLKALVTLNIGENKIQYVPFSIRHLRGTLSYLYLNGNEIRRLPSVLQEIRLNELRADCNKFELPLHTRTVQEKVQSLKFLAINAVVNYRIPFSEQTVPKTLCHLIEESPRCYNCYRVCDIDNVIQYSYAFESTCKHTVTSYTRTAPVGSCVFCNECERKHKI